MTQAGAFAGLLGLSVDAFLERGWTVGCWKIKMWSWPGINQLYKWATSFGFFQSWLQRVKLLRFVEMFWAWSMKTYPDRLWFSTGTGPQLPHHTWEKSHSEQFIIPKSIKLSLSSHQRGSVEYKINAFVQFVIFSFITDWEEGGKHSEIWKSLPVSQTAVAY